jgi:integrase
VTRSRVETLAEALELEAQAFELLAKAKRMQAAETRATVAESAALDELVGLREASRRFGLSVRQLRDAVKGGKLPKRRRGKRGYLVSAVEVMKLVEVNRVQPKWRLAVALAVNLYARLSELRALRWADVDLEDWTVHVHQALDRNTGKAKRTKTGNARRVSIEPAVRSLLAIMHKRRKIEHVFAFPSDRDIARGLHRWLWHAGVRREELHTKAPTRDGDHVPRLASHWAHVDGGARGRRA